MPKNGIFRRKDRTGWAAGILEVKTGPAINDKTGRNHNHIFGPAFSILDFKQIRKIRKLRYACPPFIFI